MDNTNIANSESTVTTTIAPTTVAPVVIPEIATAPTTTVPASTPGAETTAQVTTTPASIPEAVTTAPVTIIPASTPGAETTAQATTTPASTPGAVTTAPVTIIPASTPGAATTAQATTTPASTPDAVISAPATIAPASTGNIREKFLPIGTIVLLRGAEKRLMITGYCSSLPDNPQKSYDYVACLFPEGNLAGSDVALFDHNQIAEVVHIGLVDEEFTQFDEQVKNILAEQDKAPSSPTVTAENINKLLAEIRKQGELESIPEPTAFSEEVTNVPDLKASKEKKNNGLALGEDTTVPEEKKTPEVIETPAEAKPIEEKKEEKPAPGAPVFQLQLVGEDTPTS